MITPNDKHLDSRERTYCLNCRRLEICKNVDIIKRLTTVCIEHVGYAMAMSCLHYELEQ